MTTIENLGPAERIIQTLLTYSDHMVHNRPGMVVADRANAVGVRWSPVSYKEENGEKVVYALTKSGRRLTRTRVGILGADQKIREHNRIIGEYRAPGIFPEVAIWMYRQIAEVWKLDNEFAARWASYAFSQEHRDLKVALTAFLLCQSRKGDPVKDGGKIIFFDEDYRDVGEAMMLIQRKDQKDLNPKLLMRVRQFLCLPEIAKLNRELGFGQSARNPFLGRWSKAVEKWLAYREENPKMLEGLVKAGFRTTVMDLSRSVGYRPTSPKFFELLRWKQKQAKDGRRSLVIGEAIKQAETWQGLSEEQICQRITSGRPNYKRIVGLLPKEIGLTRAILASAIEAGSLSNKDLVILTPTLEELGLLQVADVKARWERAVKVSEDMRAANIASRVRSKETKEKLQEGADLAAQKSVEESMKNMRVYVMVDISGSMQNAIEQVKMYLSKFLQAFPLDRMHVATFNTQGRVITIKHPSAAGVDAAFRGIGAGGGTNHRAAVDVLAQFKPKDDEDSLFIVVGDEGQYGTFTDAVQQSGLRPMAFGLIKMPGDNSSCVRDTARNLGIPCFMIDQNMFSDPYAIPRTIRALIAATPVGQSINTVRRTGLVDMIMKTELLQKPAWA